MATADTIIINPNISLDSNPKKTSETIDPAEIVLLSDAEKKESATEADGGSQRGIPITRKILGIFLIFLCSLQATAQGAIIKYIEVIPTGQAVMTVSFHAMCILAAVAGYCNISLIRFPYKKFIFTRCIIGGLAYVAKIWSYRNMPFGDANALIFTIPFFAGIIARFYLKEKYTLMHVLATLCGLAGIVLVAKPSFLFSGSGYYTEEWYVIVPLLAAVLMG